MLSLFVILGTSFLACKTEGIEKDCIEVDLLKCSEVPPDKACRAYFETWFYDKTTSMCNKIGYSGCSAKGFATKEECESCKCKTDDTER